MEEKQFSLCFRNSVFAWLHSMQEILPSTLLCAYVCVVMFLFTGVDLSNIVKAIPKISSEESTEDQTHEVLQVYNTDVLLN